MGTFNSMQYLIRSWSLLLTLLKVTESCYVTCGSCTGPLSTDCISCQGGATLASGPPGACQCSGSAYFDTTTLLCTVCSPACLTCQGALASSCNTCVPGTSMTGGPPGTCKCPAAAYFNSVTLSCASCSPTCATCQGGLTTDCLNPIVFALDVTKSMGEWTKVRKYII